MITGTEMHDPTAEVTVTIQALVGRATYDLGNATIYGPDTSHTQVVALLRSIADEVEAA